MSLENSQLIQNEFSGISTYFFNSAYFGPSPARSKQKVLTALHKEIDPSFYQYESWAGIPDRIRAHIAKLLNCSDKNISHATSTTDIINLIANSFPFDVGDIVCAIDKDYPSNILPWMVAENTRGIKFERLITSFPTVDFLKKNLPKNTKVFNTSHVTFDTGKRIPLLEIGSFLKERGIFFIVDATQSLGGIEITKKELEVIDVLACSTYKWMLCPYGSAFAYYSDSALEKIKQISGNWIVSKNSKELSNLLNYTTENLPGARKFDRGQSPNMLITACMEGALEVLNEIGLEKIEAHNAEVRDYFLDNYPKSKYDIITPLDAKSNILCLNAKSGDANKLENELKYSNIDVSVREGRLRLSFHLFNTKSQVDLLIKALDH